MSQGSTLTWQHDSMTNNHKQWLLSIDMKTKVVQHVLVINISTWHMTAWQDCISTFQHYNIFYLGTSSMIPSVSGQGDSVKKKNIPIFTYKNWVFSLDMKTKLVEHVPRINIMHLTYDNMSYIIWHHDSMTNKHKQWLLSIAVKTKVVQHVLVIKISTWHMTAWQHGMTAWQTIINSDFWA